MKSYTDIEQSKKLADILPLESADMTYCAIHNIGQATHHCNVPIFAHAVNENIPCWSLAALLNVLPFPSLHKTFTGYRCDSYNKEGTTCKFGESADNPIDAAYKTIIMLNELNLL